VEVFFLLSSILLFWCQYRLYVMIFCINKVYDVIFVITISVSFCANIEFGNFNLISLKFSLDQLEIYKIKRSYYMKFPCHSSISIYVIKCIDMVVVGVLSRYTSSTIAAIVPILMYEVDQIVKLKYFIIKICSSSGRLLEYFII